ncbi:MAG: hypothetical protein ACOC1L_01125 [Bacillota bacterium]
MKKLIILLLFVILIPISIQETTADLGPKPFVEVTIKGVDVPYSVDFLIESSMLDSDNINYYKDDYPNALKTYTDSDGFIPYTLSGEPGMVKQINHSDTYTIDYFAPKTFKIAVVVGDDVIVSEIVNTVFFGSEVTYDLSSVSLNQSQSEVGTISGDIEGNFPYFKLSVNYLYRLIITLLIEIGILYVFIYRKKTSYQLVIGVNTVTQVILTGLIIYGYYYLGGVFGAILLLFLGEAIVFLLEAILFGIYLKEHSRWRAIIYAISANTATFILSLILIAFF